MNNNIIKKIELNEECFALKVKDPVYHIMYRGASSNIAPYVAYFGEGKKRIKETVVPMFFAPQYFHNFLELFPKIIKLKEECKEFKILFITEYDIDEKTGLPEILIEGTAMNISSDKCLYLKRFYDFLGIDILFISFNDFQSASFDYSYVFYEKTGDRSDYGVWKLWPDELKIKCDNKLDCYSQDLFLEGHSAQFYFANIEIMQNFFPEYQTNSEQKIYISRKNFWARRLKEEEKIEKYMVENGYAIVYLEDYPVEDQIKIIRQSAEIVCLSGSSLVNCMLANPGTKVIELSFDNPPIVYLYAEAFKKYGIDHKFIHVKQDVLSIIKSLEEIAS